MKDFFENLWPKSPTWLWFVRGVAFAISISALVVGFVEWNVKWFPAFHAMLISWNDAMAWVGEVIGKIPFIPTVPSYVCNAFVLFFSVAIPAAIYYIKNLAGTFYFRKKAYSTDEYFVAAKDAITVSMTTMMPFLVMRDFVVGSPTADDKFTNTMNNITITLFIIYILWKAYIPFLRSTPVFLYGIAFTFGFVCFMETFYWLNTPLVSDWIESTVCEENTNLSATCPD